MELSQEITTVIPVFDAEKTVAAACASALAQPQVKEVLLVEDGSSDNSLRVCQELASTDERVRLLQHDGGSNRGAGASRNLGWRAATTEWISFLDSDDWFLDGHSERTLAVLADDPRLDGCHGPVRIEFESPELRQTAIAEGSVRDGREILAIDSDVTPDELLKALIVGGRGGVQTAGITVRKTLLEEVGGFDESLELSQDFELWLRLASAGRLGRISGAPIAVYWINSTSRSAFNNRRSKFWRVKMAESFLRWGQQTDAKSEDVELARQQFAACWQQHIDFEVEAGKSEGGLQLRRLAKVVALRPCSLVETVFWKDVAWSLGLTRPM